MTYFYLFRVLEQTCVNQVKRLDSKVSAELVSSMLRAMTENAAHEPGVQMGASAVLVAVGHEYLDLVNDLILNHHYYHHPVEIQYIGLLKRMPQ